MKTICSFHTGSAVDFWVQVRPCEATEVHFQKQFTEVQKLSPGSSNPPFV